MTTYVDQLAPIAAAADAQIADLATQLATANSNLAIATQQGVASQATILSLQNQVSSLTAQLAALQAKYDAYVASHPGVVRPDGLGFVRYEDLYVAGDTVPAALARLGAGSKNVWKDGTGYITFPEGVFEFSDFADPKALGNPYGIFVPKNCKGFRGSGRGNLGEDSGTIITMKPNSSTKTTSGNTSQVTMLYRGTGVANDLQIIFDNFQLRGTAQGDVNGKQYHGMSMTNPESPVLVADVFICGWYGNGGANPKETFGWGISDGKKVGGHRYLRCESDGRRTKDGPNYGAVGFTAENWHDGDWTDVYSHHTQASQAVFFQSSGATTHNLQLGSKDGDNGTNFTAGVNQGQLNQEQTANITHFDPVFNFTEGEGGHVSHANGQFTVPGGVSVADGKVTIHNPRYHDIRGDGYFYVISGTTEPGGDSMVTPPVVLKADGSKLPYIWGHGPKGAHYLIS